MHAYKDKQRLTHLHVRTHILAKHMARLGLNTSTRTNERTPTHTAP